MSAVSTMNLNCLDLLLFSLVLQNYRLSSKPSSRIYKFQWLPITFTIEEWKKHICFCFIFMHQITVNLRYEPPFENSAMKTPKNPNTVRDSLLSCQIPNLLFRTKKKTIYVLNITQHTPEECWFIIYIYIIMISHVSNCLLKKMSHLQEKSISVLIH